MNKEFLMTMVLIGVVAIWGSFSTAYCDHHNLNEAQRGDQAQQQGRAQEQAQQQGRAQEQAQQQGRAQEAQAQEQVDEVNPEDPQFQEQVEKAREEMEVNVEHELNEQENVLRENPGAFAQDAADAADAGDIGGQVLQNVADGVEVEVANEVVEDIGREL